jgi:hypothetical protein
MNRDRATITVHRITESLMKLERELPTLRTRIHGASLLLTQVLATTRRMSDRDALAALARAAETVSEILLLRALPQFAAPRAALIKEHGADLLSLAHEQMLSTLMEPRPSSPAAAAHS